jgi:ribosomal protein S18 acetylase RimI-like enzyme
VSIGQGSQNLAMGTCDGLIHLRRATEADARAIAEVHVDTWRRAYRGLVAQDLLDSLNVDSRERFWQRALAAMPADRRPWLAEADTEVVGFVSAGAAEDQDAKPTTGQVYAIYVSADCWDRGVGRNLLGHAERDLRDHTYVEATLWVLATNERARRFYEAAGWHPDGAEQTQTFGGAELHEVRYRKTLERPTI